MDGVLYPKGLSPNDNVREICEKFYLAGVFVARSIIDEVQILDSLIRLLYRPMEQEVYALLCEHVRIREDKVEYLHNF